VCAAPVPAVFDAARHGVPTPEDVQPLPFTAEQIERWLHQLEREEKPRNTRKRSKRSPGVATPGLTPS